MSFQNILFLGVFKIIFGKCFDVELVGLSGLFKSGFGRISSQFRFF